MLLLATHHGTCSGDVVRKLPLDLTYEDGPGKHNWTYWDKMIQRVLVWMFPVRKKAEEVPER